MSDPNPETPVDMRAVCDALGFDPTNHHNAAKCPYCSPQKTPTFGPTRDVAFEIYKPPFKYLHGFIYDSNNNMVADDEKVDGAIAARIRGWGKLKYIPKGAEIQDELGTMLAEALTEFWNKPRSGQ